MLLPGVIAPLLLLIDKPLGLAVYVPFAVPVRVTFTGEAEVQNGEPA